MKRLGVWVQVFALCFCARTAAQTIVSMDDEPHYTRVFANDKCRAFVVSLGRLEETKPVVHEHDWVHMTLAGTVERAWGGTLFTLNGYEDPEGYIISFSRPVDRLTLRNPRNEPYREMIVEIMKSDNSRNQINDPSLDPFRDSLGPGVDSHVSFVTALTKTSVEILNVQVVGGDKQQIRSEGSSALLIAMTDLDLIEHLKDGEKRIRLDKGEVKWMPDGATATYKNDDKLPARFVIVGLK